MLQWEIFISYDPVNVKRALYIADDIELRDKRDPSIPELKECGFPLAKFVSPKIAIKDRAPSLKTVKLLINLVEILFEKQFKQPTNAEIIS